jgi:hypothetical protein
MTKTAVLLALAVTALASMPAQAQPTRAFVSGLGLDTNPCTVTQPCRKMQRPRNGPATSRQHARCCAAGADQGAAIATASARCQPAKTKVRASPDPHMYLLEPGTALRRHGRARTWLMVIAV